MRLSLPLDRCGLGIIWADLQSRLKGHFLSALLIILAGVIVYFNSLSVPFVFDDDVYIKNNPIIKSFSYIADPSLAGGLDLNSNIVETIRSRRVVYFTFFLNYLAGGLDVKGFHVVNIAIHISNALLVYFLVLITSRTPYMRRSMISGQAAPLALCASLIFLLHPVQTEAVTYISQRFASMATMFYLLCIVLYAAFRLSEGGPGKYAYYAISMLSAVLAMQCKEIAFTLPIAVALYEFSFFQCAKSKRAALLLLLMFTMLIIPLIRLRFGGDLAQSLNMATRADEMISRHDYLITQFSVIATYLRLFFLPLNQNFDYSYPLYHDLFQPEVIMPLALLLTVFGSGIYAYRVSERREPAFRLAGFGVLWFFLALSVESSIIPLNDLIFEHRMYLPLAGLATSVITLAFIAAERWGNMKRPLVVIFVLAVVFLSIATVMRNAVWRDEKGFWEDTVAKSPEKSRPHYDLGIEYLELGRSSDAEMEFKKALKLAPDSEELYVKVGQYYERLGRDKEAESEYLAALKIDPGFAEAHNGLGNVYSSRKRYALAQKEYEKAVRLDPDLADAHNNLGVVHEYNGRIREAIVEYRRALQADPEFYLAHFNLGVVFESKGMYEEAQKHFRAAIEINPEFSEAYFSLGQLSQAHGRTEEAIRHFESVLEIDSEHAEAHLGLCMVFGKLENYLRAVKECQEAARIDPELSRAHFNIGLIYLIWGEYAKALHKFQNAVSLEPDNITYQEYLTNTAEMVFKLTGR